MMGTLLEPSFYPQLSLRAHTDSELAVCALQKEGPRVAFRDNDSLAALLSIELKADLLVLLTDVEGLYDGPPADPSSNFIATYCPEVHDELIKFGDPSQGGRGGMVSKV